jgi:hypothetical protein
MRCRQISFDLDTAELGLLMTAVEDHFMPRLNSPPCFAPPPFLGWAVPCPGCRGGRRRPGAWRFGPLWLPRLALSLGLFLALLSGFELALTVQRKASNGPIVPYRPSIRTILGNHNWQSNERHGADCALRAGFECRLWGTKRDGTDGLDNPDGPPKPVAKVRVLPGAFWVLACPRFVTTTSLRSSPPARERRKTDRGGGLGSNSDRYAF